MFQEVDPVLGPEMRSTGEVLGLSADFGEAFYKAQEATQTRLPIGGCVLMSVSDRNKDELVDLARSFHECGFTIMATEGCWKLITANGIPVSRVNKLNEGRPNILDEMTNGHIQMIINTPNDKKGATDDSYLRKSAIKYRIPYMTTMAAAKASVEAIRSMQSGKELPVKSLQAFHAEITDR